MINSIKSLESVSCGGDIVDMLALKDKYPEKFSKDDGQMDYNWFETEIRPNYNVYVRHDVDSISFTMMTKPASEGGKGCQLTDLVEIALTQLKYFNAKFPCVENEHTIKRWEEGLEWQKRRTADRELREVEGKDLQ